MKNDMPEEIWAYHDFPTTKRSGAWMIEFPVIFEGTKYIRADLTEPVIDDGLLAEATYETERAALVKEVGECCMGADPLCAGGCLVEKAIRKRLTHALKTREEVVEVTVDELRKQFRPYALCSDDADICAFVVRDKYPAGIKIINPPNNRDEEKI